MHAVSKSTFSTYIDTNILMLALRYSYEVISQVLRILKKHQNHLHHSIYEVSYYNVPVQTLKTLNNYVLLNMYVHALSKQILIYDCLILVHTLIMRYHPATISTFNSLISIKHKRLI